MLNCIKSEEMGGLTHYLLKAKISPTPLKSACVCSDVFAFKPPQPRSPDINVTIKRKLWLLTGELTSGHVDGGGRDGSFT